MKKRLIVSILLLGLVALLAGPVSAGEGVDTPRDIRIAINPFSASAGTAISVSGSGAEVGRQVVVTLSIRADSAEGALLSITVDPAADGTFSTTVTVPNDTADGRYYIRAEQFTDNGNVLQYYYNELVIGNPGEEAFLPETGQLSGVSLTVTAALGLLLFVALILRGVYALSVRK